MILAGFDYETELLGPENLAPSPVCLSAYLLDGDQTVFDEDLVDSDCLELATTADADVETLMADLLDGARSGDCVMVGANIAFDLAVANEHHPDLRDRILRAFEEGRVADVQVREKLLDLADTGDLDYVQLPDGGKRKKNAIGYYALSGLVSRYLGIEMVGKTKIKDGKIIGEDTDSWRHNYDVLMDVKLEDWPEEAVEYSLLDSVYPTLIYNCQEQRRAELTERLGIDPLKTEAFRTQLRFSLYLMSQRGLAVDPENHRRIQAELAEVLRPENLTLLMESGILRPDEPPRPHARGARNHVDGCKKKGCDCPVKMTAGKKGGLNKKRLIEFVEDLAKADETITLRYTEKGNLQVDREFLDDHARKDPTLLQLQNRQSVQKLVTTDLPRMEWPHGSGTPAKVVHPSFDFLKETGRTSSFASKAYPSMGCQNPHPKVRHSVVPRDGYVLYSVDYSGMELGTLAQKCVDLFGYSVLADKINAGYDAHAYLGSQLARHLDNDFAESCSESGADSPDQIYAAFMACKTSEHEDVRKFFKRYRTFAKPTGLGYPGGLGPATFVDYAWATFKIEVDEAQAKVLKEIWLLTYPEMVDYFRWINKHCEDPHHHDAYAYGTRMGMYRANCSYCACANGAGLQSPSAEGALLAVNRVTWATHDPSSTSVLSDDERGPRHRALMFIHDEIIGEARLDCAHEVAHAVSSIMIDSMRVVTPDVIVRAEPVLMTRWDKAATQVWSDGRLVAYDPFKEQTA